MRHSPRSPEQAARQDRRTALNVVCGGRTDMAEAQEPVRAWLEDGSVPDVPYELLAKAILFASELALERNRTTYEVAMSLGKTDGHQKGDHVAVEDRHSKHYGREGVVWFVRNGRVMVTMEAPMNISGCESDSFLPEHLRRLDKPAPQSLERPLLLRVLRENAEINENLSSTQERCTVLLEATRAMRLRIVELGGEDPGPA